MVSAPRQPIISKSSQAAAEETFCSGVEGLFSARQHAAVGSNPASATEVCLPTVKTCVCVCVNYRVNLITVFSYH